MEIVGLPEFVLVAFDNPLDLRFEAFDSLSSDFGDTVLFPLLASHFLGGLPSIFILFQLNFVSLLYDFLLLVQILIFVLSVLL